MLKLINSSLLLAFVPNADLQKTLSDIHSHNLVGKKLTVQVGATQTKITVEDAK